MKKVAIFSLIVTLVLGMFASFAFAEELVINSMHSDPAPKEAFATIVAKFQELNPDIEVKLNTTDHEGFKSAVRLWLASDNPPDVVTWFAGNRAMFFIDKGLIMDITDVWEEAGLFEKFPKGFQSISFKDGKAYFLPDTYYWWAVYYRKSIFEQYNLSEPKTWDELLKVCATLKENGVTPFTIGTKYRWTAAAWFDYMNMRVNGPEFHMGLMLGTEKYTDPKMKKVFETWRQLLDNGYFIDNAASYTWQEAMPFMVRGEAAMYLMGQFILDSVPDDIEDDVDFFQFPIIDPSVPVGEDAPTDGYMIPAKAKNVEAAKKFLTFLASPEAQQVQVEKVGRIVTSTEIPMDLYPAPTQKGIKMMQGVDAVAQFYDRDTIPEMADEGMDGFMEWWYKPDNIDKILERLEKERERIFKAQE
jgi:multiple sugar transport system substrate-binding protein/raffinose/stachyose/melibiose transport system substrate-binding protein